ncbi:rCG62967 [Rattus norvegicus]|uniref:RCG62967 n=1 Tax=Rattus norvegicus TaxID=10116 RepID=A6HP92_RAT|nr:rCG62967 [Rattus norvegicus]
MGEILNQSSKPMRNQVACRSCQKCKGSLNCPSALNCLLGDSKDGTSFDPESLEPTVMLGIRLTLHKCIWKSVRACLPS